MQLSQEDLFSHFLHLRRAERSRLKGSSRQLALEEGSSTLQKSSIAGQEPTPQGTSSSSKAATSKKKPFVAEATSKILQPFMTEDGAVKKGAMPYLIQLARRIPGGSGALQVIAALRRSDALLQQRFVELQGLLLLRRWIGQCAIEIDPELHHLLPEGVFRKPPEAEGTRPQRILLDSLKLLPVLPLMNPALAGQVTPGHIEMVMEGVAHIPFVIKDLPESLMKAAWDNLELGLRSAQSYFEEKVLIREKAIKEEQDARANAEEERQQRAELLKRIQKQRRKLGLPPLEMEPYRELTPEEHARQVRERETRETISNILSLERVIQGKDAPRLRRARADQDKVRLEEDAPDSGEDELDYWLNGSDSENESIDHHKNEPRIAHFAPSKMDVSLPYGSWTRFLELRGGQICSKRV